MSLVFAAFTPHPPIMVPEVGGVEVKKMEPTVRAMLRLAQEFAAAKPEVVIVISPHAPVLHDRIGLTYTDRLSGNFSQFGADYHLEFAGDKALADAIIQASFTKKVALDPYTNRGTEVEIDHGTMVPLYYLAHAHYDFKLIISSFSDFSFDKHFAYGEALFQAINASPKRIALIASGDLSHRLKEDGPYGFDPAGPQFDEALVDLVAAKNTEAILSMDDELREDAGECGYRSLVILLGALNQTDYQPQVYSYEGPFGVGYMVARFR